jgi:4-alpha-glucanotransferase
MHLAPEKPIAGVLAPLFALRTENDLGIGDTDALRELVDWAADIGFRLVQLLPINETGGDNSPYMAISSAALEPSTIATRPGRIPDLSESDFDAELARVDLAALRSGAVQYRFVKPLKLGLLERAFAAFSETHFRRNSSRAKRFRAFVKEQAAWLEGYALFRVLMEENGGSERWDLWPEEHSSIARAREWLASLPAQRRRALDRRARFHQYVQWIAFTQWREVKAYCDSRDVALMGDVPFGISYYSADVFTRPELFELEWSGGAPPEPYFKDSAFTQKWGQNWGVPLYRWDVMQQDGLAWWRQRVHLVREMFHLFRIDHVLGFYRIYGFPWRPERNDEFLPLTHQQARERTGGELPHFVSRDDSTHENRDENRRAGEEYLRKLLEVVGEHRLIGEDLGTVPPYVRPSLSRMGIAGFKIPMWEKKDDGWLIDGKDYQRLSVVTYATHDHEPLRALWNRWKRTVETGGPERQEALDQMVRFAAFAHIDLRWAEPWSDALHEKLLRALFRSNSWIAIAMITDLFASEQRFNVPGAIAESNWSARLPETISDWKSTPWIRQKMECVARLLHETGRA